MKNFKNIIFIVLSISLMAGIIFYFGFKAQANKYSSFRSSGYIISKNYDSAGDYITNEKYYFNDQAKYKTNYQNQVDFESNDESKVSVNNDVFVHYDNGGISVMKKAAILSLDNLSKDNAIKYYSIYANSLLENKSGTYSVKNNNSNISFNNFVIKTNDNKYLVAGNKMDLSVGDSVKSVENGYLEVEFFEGNIVRIDNNEISVQNIPTNMTIQFGNGVKLNLENKQFYIGVNSIVSLDSITIDSSDNIDLVELVDEYVPTPTPTATPEEVRKNPITGLNSGVINSGVNSDEEEVNENAKDLDPEFNVNEFKFDSYKLNASISITDDSNLLKGDIVVKIINVVTNKIVYQSKEAEGTYNFGVQVENLSPGTSYIFIVSSNYTKDVNEYTRDFVQKAFITDEIGVSIDKEIFSTTALSFTSTKQDYSELSGFTAVLVDQNNTTIASKKISFEESNRITFGFDNLVHNTTYMLKTQNYIYSDSIVSEYQLENSSYTTLKYRPVLGINEFVIDKKNSLFTLKNSNIQDVDNGITSFRYEVYDARDLDNPVPIQVIDKNNKGSVDLNVDDSTIYRGTPYVFKVIATFYDNEKEYEYESAYSNSMKMDGVGLPYIRFEESEVTFERIKGNIIIVDDGNTIALDDSNKITVVYTNSVGQSATFTSVGNLNIPFNYNGLRSNETYTISVYATVNLQDGNPPIDNYYLGSALVTTKETNPMSLTYTMDSKNATSAFLVHARLSNFENNDTTLEANTMTGIIFNLYEGQSVNGTLKKSVKKVDRNLNEYESDLKSLYYDKTFDIDPSFFNLKNQDLNSEYYTIEVKFAYDYVKAYTHSDMPDDDCLYPNIIPIEGGKITVKTVGYVPSYPSDTSDAIMITPVRNKDAKDEQYRSDLELDTIVGYQLKASYDNSNKFAKSITYNMYNALTGTLLKSWTKDVKPDGSFDPLNLNVGDGTPFSTIDNEFRRGSIYYFTYTAELDLNLDGIAETHYPTDSSVVLRSKNVEPVKQSPNIIIYPSNSTSNSFTWKYKINDIDHGLYDSNFHYFIDKSEKTPVSINANNTMNDVIFNDLSIGYLNVLVKQALLKTEDNIQDNSIIYQKFYGINSAPNISYTVNGGTNRLIISFKDYDAIEFYDSIAGVRVEMTCEGKKIVKDFQTIVDGNVVIDYDDIEEFINKPISVAIYAYYDSYINGFDLGEGYTALQLIDNDTVDLDGKYFYLTGPTTLANSYSASKSLFTTKLNYNNSTLSIYSLIYGKENVFPVIINHGINYNYEYIIPKKLEELKASNIGEETFKFDKIIPSISLLSSKNTTEIIPSLIDVKINAKIFGAGNNRIQDNKIFIDVYEVALNNVSTKVSTTEFKVEDFSSTVVIDGLKPSTNYYIKFYANILSGDSYSSEQLYDIDFQSNTKLYYFKTYSDIGIKNITHKYSASSFDKRNMVFTYNLEQTLGFDRIEYELYKLVTDGNGNVSEELMDDIKIDEDTFFSSDMQKSVPIPIGCGVDTTGTYRLRIKPFAEVEIAGEKEDVALSENTFYDFKFAQLSVPYVGVSSTVTNYDTAMFKVNFYDWNKTTIDGVYTITILDYDGNDVTPSDFVDAKYATNGTKSFSISGLESGKRYTFIVNYQLNITNEKDNIIIKSKSYAMQMNSTNGISIGNVSVAQDVNTRNKMRLLFYDSNKITDITRIKYTVYDSNGVSSDYEETFTPYSVTINDIQYYYFTLSKLLNESGQYYLQIQFLEGDVVIAEESLEYNYLT